MALESYNATLKKWENVVRVNLKVTNPALLKSGALGVLVNFLAGIKYDTVQFYSKTFQEMNIGLAQDFNSLLYHSTVYGAALEFASPATLSASLVIPEITINQVEELIHTIPRFTKFQDDNGISFIFTSEITLKMTKGGLNATSWNPKGTKNLTVTRAANPNSPGNYVFLIHTSDIQQFTRTFSNFITPEYNTGDFFEFNTGVNSIKEIKEIRAWLNTGDEKIDLNMLDGLSEDEILKMRGSTPTSFNIKPLNIKYHKFDSSIKENNIFITIYEKRLSFETGNGYNGLIPPGNSQIIIETQETLGDGGNIVNSEFLVSDIKVRERIGGLLTYNTYTTSINGVSTTGSSGGYSIPNVDRIREAIFDRITVRNSIITENDYERLFEYQDVKPFVDAKFIDAKAFVFLFNVIRENDNIIKSTTMNIPEPQLFEEPFYPEVQYKGVTLTSPFYYKNKDENQVSAYIVNPEVVFDLQPDLTSPAYETESDYRISLSLMYDFGERKSRLTITGGAKYGHVYKFKAEGPSGIIQMILNESNDYSLEINETYTDPYCIIRDHWTNIVVTVVDADPQLVTYSPETKIIYKTPVNSEYTQLHKKQTFYKYFQELDQGVEPISISGSTGYLDNYYEDIMSTPADIIHNRTINNVAVEPIVLRMPFIDSDYFYSKSASDIFEIMDKYFISDFLQDSINYNTQLTQCFHNTIDIPLKYHDHLFEEMSMPLLIKPEIKIDLDLFLDADAFIVSPFQTRHDFEIAAKINIITFLKNNEGFMIDYFETDLEKNLYNEFSPIIRNVKVNSPTLFRVNNSAVVYSGIQNNLPFKDSLDFIPPYFYYDYKNITLNINM